MKKLFAIVILLGAAILLAANSSAAIIPVTGAPLVSLDQFVSVVAQGNANQVVGVYVPDTLALRVLQQPENNPAYVSTIQGSATQFRFAAQRGTTGLLAHNYLAGAEFANLELGAEVDVVMGDGAVKKYRVSKVEAYQALKPSSPFSDFVNLETGEKSNSTAVFNAVYGGGNVVVFQTCIEKDGELSWGRLFVIATPQP